MNASNEAIKNLELPTTVYVETLLKPYLRDFILERFKDISEISSANESSQWDTIKKLGHKIKGSAGSYGFGDLGKCGPLLERLADSHDSESIRHLVQKMEQHLKTVSIIYTEEEE